MSHSSQYQQSARRKQVIGAATPPGVLVPLAGRWRDRLGGRVAPPSSRPTNLVLECRMRAAAGKLQPDRLRDEEKMPVAVMIHVSHAIASPRVSAACGDRDLHAAEGRLGQLSARGSGCQNRVEPIVTYGYAVGHAGFQRCVAFGAGSEAHGHGQRDGVAFGGDARSDERFALSEKLGVDDALRPDDLAIFAVHAEVAAVLFVAPDVASRVSGLR